MLLYRSGRVELFAFRARPERPNSAHGLTLRIARPTGWRHVSAFVRPRASRPLPGGRGVITWELCSWRTGPDKRTRTSIKAFVRLKVGLGGVTT